jgi:hypothetical protein
LAISMSELDNHAGCSGTCALRSHLLVRISRRLAQAYKRQYATHLLGVRDYALPFSAQGSLVTAAARLIPEFKSTFANLPLGIRKVVLAFGAAWALRPKRIPELPTPVHPAILR